MFIVLLNFSSSLVRKKTKFLFLNYDPCMVGPSLINLNHVELKYYPFMISIDKYSRSCNAWYAKISVLKQAKDVNIKAFNIIANKNEAKAMENIFHMIVNAVSLKQYVIQMKNGITKHVNVNVKNTVHTRSNIVGILSLRLMRKVSI